MHQRNIKTMTTIKYLFYQKSFLMLLRYHQYYQCESFRSVCACLYPFYDLNQIHVYLGIVAMLLWIVHLLVRSGYKALPLLQYCIFRCFYQISASDFKARQIFFVSLNKKFYVIIFFLIAVYLFFFWYSNKRMIIVEKRVPRYQIPFAWLSLSVCGGMYFFDIFYVVTKNLIVCFYIFKKIVYWINVVCFPS